jgi:hypothetical protein
VELNIKDQKSLLALWSLTSQISNRCLHIVELRPKRMSKPLLALWSLTSKEWLNPWLHIVELISIKRYLNHCVHCGAFYYEFFACLPFNKAFINFSFIIFTKNFWIENDGLELWNN